MSSRTEYALSRQYRASARLSLQHLLLRKWQGYLIHPTICPHLRGASIADVGTGTASWIMDVAREFPEADAYHGFDIDLRQTPRTPWLPDRVSMREFDIFGPVPADIHAKYDLVHVRLLICVIRTEDISVVLGNLKKLLRPGGYIQWTEMNPSSSKLMLAEESSEAPAVQSALDALYKERLQPMAGENPGWIVQLAKYFEASGLTDVSSSHSSIPKEDFPVMLDNALLCTEDLSIHVPNGDEIRQRLEAAAKELALLERGVGLDLEIWTCIGRKQA